MAGKTPIVKWRDSDFMSTMIFNIENPFILIRSWRADAASRRASRLSHCVFSAFFFNLLMSAQVYAEDVPLEILTGMDCVIQPSRTVELSSAVPGLLAETYYDRSDYVGVGTIMARLESEVERVSLRIFEQAARKSTALALRKATAEFGDRTRLRNAELFESSSISQQVMDQVATEAVIAELQVEQELDSARLASLEVERAQASLDRREIKTPISGSVTQRYKSSGEYIDNDPVYQIAQLDPLNVEVVVPIDYLGSLQTGISAAVFIEVPGFRDRPLDAVVERIDSVADAASSTYGVRLSIDNPDLTIPSGVRCTVDFFSS